MEWTMEKVAALATDAGTENRGKKLAISSKWQLFATDKRALWGECKGSGSTPYYVKIDLKGPAFGCSCPVRKLPCKHIMGLFFLYAQQAHSFSPKTAPQWVQDWIKKRDTKLGNTEVKTNVRSEKELEKARKAKEKREAQKLARMQAGVDELEQWLMDLVRQGFANVEINKRLFWEQAAAKMMDAQLSRVSYFMKETAEIALKSEDWMDLVTARIGALYLLVKAFRNIEQLSPEMKEEVMNTLGRTLKKKDVLEENPHIQDKWLVIAKKEEMDLEGRQIRRLWLLGVEQKKQALILDYAFGNAGFEQQYVVGSVLDATLAYYPASLAQRAVLNHSSLIDFEVNELPYFSDSIDAFFAEYAAALKLNPWLTHLPVILMNVLPFRDEFDNYYLRDVNHKVLPLSNLRARVIWRMLALSGGQPISIIGEWNGRSFEALSIWTGLKIEEL
jgi:hypothetical protein